MESGYNSQVVLLTELVSAKLPDADGLAAMVVAASGAVGMFALEPPTVREEPKGIAVGMLCRDGHIVLHLVREEGTCLVDIVARAPADVGRGIEVIMRRLSPPD